jgi:phosphonatase-like hydrolase
MDAHVRATMGTSKIEVFTTLLGDRSAAERANAAFEAAYDALVVERGLSPVPGAESALAELRRSGRRVVLTTGFSAHTRDRILDLLGWQDLVDLALSPGPGVRGRPHPDLVLAAVLALGVGAVQAVAVAGDTVADMASGRRAGASVVAGVLTGTDDRARLEAAGATHVLPSVASLPALLA